MPEKLAELRRQKGLSQIELAEAMSVSRQAVSMWESGATIPSIDNLILLSRLYGVSVDEILGALPPEKTVMPQRKISRKAEASAAGFILLWLWFWPHLLCR